MQEECSWAGSNGEIEKENSDFISGVKHFTTTVARLQKCLFVLASFGMMFLTYTSISSTFSY